MPGSISALYASCLINIQIQTNSATYGFFGLTTNNPAGGSVAFNGASVFFDTSGRLLIAKNSAAPATNVTYSLATNTTQVIVIRYKYIAGAPDRVDLWLDPTSLGNDASVPPPTITTTNNANLASNYFSAVAYFESPSPTLFYWDEVRVATNWAAVTPTTPSPGTTYSVTGGGSTCGVSSYPVGLSGSDSGVTDTGDLGVLDGTVGAAVAEVPGSRRSEVSLRRW